MVTRSPRGSAGAFTLIELLVVVAIIAMLMSVLLPSMAKARDQAKAAVCLSRLKNLGVAQQAYQNENTGHIPGSPLTTGMRRGLVLPRGAGEPPWTPGPVNSFDYCIPLLQQMNVSLPKATPGVSWSDLRKAYFPITTSGPMECPSNNQVVPAWNPNTNAVDPNLPKIRAISYLTMNTIVRGGAAVYNQYRSKAGYDAWALGQPLGKDSNLISVEVPSSYFPRIEAIGRASLKVFLADGARFVKDETYMDYDSGTNGFAGYHSAQPPSDYSTQSGYAREYTIGRKFSYRHGGGRVINAVMFDGHAEPLRATWKTTGKVVDKATGPAVHPKYYFPTRSVVVRRERLWARDEIVNGTVLP